MPREPRTADFPRIRTALGFYRVLAYATGVFLLILVVEIVLKYGYGLELQGGGGAFLSFVPADRIAPDAVNVSLIVQITHGYLYLAYLISDFVLVTFMRWPIMRFVLIAAGGVVPFLSFIVEHRVQREVRQFMASRAAGADQSTVPAPEASH